MNDATGPGDKAGEGGTLLEYLEEDAELTSLLRSTWYESRVLASISAVDVDGLRCKAGAILAEAVEASLDIGIDDRFEDESWNDAILGVTGVEPAFMEASTGGEVDRLRFDSTDERLAGGDGNSPIFNGEAPDEEEAAARGVDGLILEYCSIDSGDALLRLRSDFMGRAGEAPREELLEEAPREEKA